MKLHCVLSPWGEDINFTTGASITLQSTGGGISK
jgi:hypothetical protein